MLHLLLLLICIIPVLEHSQCRHHCRMQNVVHTTLSTAYMYVGWTRTGQARGEHASSFLVLLKVVVQAS